METLLLVMVGTLLQGMKILLQVTVALLLQDIEIVLSIVFLLLLALEMMFSVVTPLPSATASLTPPPAQ